MSPHLHDLTRFLAEKAEAVCHHYLSNGRRVGGYWIVGDARNTPGRSMFVRLNGYRSGKGAPGKWTDYVARWVMLRPRAGRLFCEATAASPQHNLSSSGRVA
jgi:hypothetical protein